VTTHETDLSTEPAEAQAPPRFPRAHGESGRPESRKIPPRQRPQAALGLTGPATAPGGRGALAVEFLRKRADYLALRDGARAGTPAFLMVKRRRGDGSETVRVGLTTTKKLGGAVIRNRIRRRLRAGVREVFPLNADAGCDYVLIARAAAFDRDWAELLDDMKRGLLRLSRVAT